MSSPLSEASRINRINYRTFFFLTKFQNLVTEDILYPDYYWIQSWTDCQYELCYSVCIFRSDSCCDTFVRGILIYTEIQAEGKQAQYNKGRSNYGSINLESIFLKGDGKTKQQTTKTNLQLKIGALRLSSFVLEQIFIDCSEILNNGGYNGDWQLLS